MNRKTPKLRVVAGLGLCPLRMLVSVELNSQVRTVLSTRRVSKHLFRIASTRTAEASQLFVTNAVFLPVAFGRAAPVGKYRWTELVVGGQQILLQNCFARLGVKH